jgi:hypothetical protein
LDAKSLLSAAAVRAKADEMLQLALDGRLAEWTADLDRLPAAADLTAQVIRDQYPTLAVPFHARWRHFSLGGQDLWAQMADKLIGPARGRAAFDLAITSVLLDAGSGPDWAFFDAATGLTERRSEGLGIASLRLFEAGAFSADPVDPLRADAGVLARFDARALAAAFQVSKANPLVGLEGRAALLRRLGEAALARPDLFALADTPRPGGLFDLLVSRAAPKSGGGGRLPAPAILDAVLEGLGPIWPGRPSLDGVSLGDTWPHPVAGLTPLHKLSQWLSYSLIEPLQEAGIEVVDIDGLTGLAEYRNGGLFIDAGVLTLRDPADMARAHPVDSPLVVGWRSLTVALLDRIAPLVRERLGVTAEAFPLARVLEGGTWAAGRRIAAEKRAGGGPPLTIISDGAVF